MKLRYFLRKAYRRDAVPCSLCTTNLHPGLLIYTALETLFLHG